MLLSTVLWSFTGSCCFFSTHPEWLQYSHHRCSYLRLLTTVWIWIKLSICSAGCLLKWWGRVLCLRAQQQEPQYNIWSVSQNNESPAPSPDCCHILKEATLTTLSSVLHLALWISSSLSLEETHSGTDSTRQWDVNTVHRMNWSVQCVQMETPGRWPLFDFRSQWLDSEICCLQHQVTGYKTAACCCWRRG